MAFPAEFINYGRLEFSSGTVKVYSSQYNSRYLPNVPNGIINAYWQGNHVVVETNTTVYIYDDIANYSNYWRK